MDSIYSNTKVYGDIHSYLSIVYGLSVNLQTITSLLRYPVSSCPIVTAFLYNNHHNHQPVEGHY